MKAQTVGVAALCLMLLPAAAGAQSAVTGAIAGVVRDASGAVLPGVTVEAASPALIEKVRVVITNGQGLYRIVDLRPGTYRVTFTLPGFSPFVRDGIGLSTAFTATVNAELRVGGIEETVTVSGAAPVVDTQNVMAREVFQREVVDALPVALNSGMWMTLIPAAKGSGSGVGTAPSSNVGGTQSERANPDFTVHGGTNDIRMAVDGMEFQRGAFSINRLSTQEVNVQIGGITAEGETGGVRMNIVPREGGNRFSATFALDGTTEGLQSNNINDRLRARGVTGSPGVKKAYNFGGAVGGPVVRDKLWFFTAHRKWGTQQWIPNRYWNATQGTPFYTPDLSRPANSDDFYRSHNARFTWQAAEKHKINLAYQFERNCNCFIRLIDQNRAPEATSDHVYTQHFPQVTWQYPATNRLLFEGVAGWAHSQRTNHRVEGVAEDHIAIVDRGLGFSYNARGDTVSGSGGYGSSDIGHNATERFAVSYVTGTHNFKTGVFVQQWPNWQDWTMNGALFYRFRNGVPIEVVQFAAPDVRRDRGNNLGIYTQDQWTVRNLTLNLGVRFDRFSAYANENSVPAGPFVGARQYAKTDNLIDFKDLAPRVGAAYDLFGNGRTAVKGFIGRYVVGRGGGTGSANPAAQIVLSATRSWNDRNGDFTPQEGELGPLSNRNFGSPVARALTIDDAVNSGFGNRAHTWQSSVSVEHELRPGLAVNVGYFRTWYGNQTFNDNLRVTPADFDEFCITAPVDARLPGNVSGSQICGLYDVKPEKFGQVSTFQSLAGSRRTRVFNGVDVGVDARFGTGGVLNAGLATGNTVIDDCGAAVDSPQALRFCRQTLAWSDDVQIKVFGAYPLPWGLQTSAVFQSLPGPPVGASHVATNAEIAPSLGRNLSAGVRGTSTLDLIEPNTVFEDRIALLDVRVSRRFRIGGFTATGNLDVANIFNTSAVESIVARYGSNWLNAVKVLSGRLVRLGVQVDF